MTTLGRVSSHRLFFYGWVKVAVTTVGLLATAVRSRCLLP